MTLAFDIQKGKSTFYFQLNELKNIQTSLNQYAQRHYQRAIIYAEKDNWQLATQELRYAIKIEPNNSYYHALLGVIHFQQDLIGMARIYIRQALKLNPENNLALKYADFLKISSQCIQNPPSFKKATGISALLNRFAPRKKSALLI
ncbi:MAG: hypothetical protein QNJ47_03485 [Nostocaceae cyanobacterium]|nr:hypothetical protein [Nostocaceae cyanobacterium]